MRLILLGCTGFIGSELVPRLSGLGHELTIITRKTPIKRKFEKTKTKVTYLNTDLNSATSWQNIELLQALEKADGVVNLVGEPIAEKRWSIKQCQKIKNSRLKTTEYLIQTISKLKSPIKVLVNGSAIGFYGTSLDATFNEQSSPGNDFLANLCKEWEQIASKKPRQTRLVIIRTGIVLEKDGGALGKMLPVFKAGFGGPIGNGMQWMSWIHRSDLCQMIENALTNSKWTGTFNGVSPNPVRMKVFSENLGKVLNRPSLLPVPGALLKLLLGDGAKVVLEGQQVTSNNLSKTNFKFQYPELNKALLDIATRI